MFRQCVDLRDTRLHDGASRRSWLLWPDVVLVRILADDGWIYHPGWYPHPGVCHLLLHVRLCFRMRLDLRLTELSTMPRTSTSIQLLWLQTRDVRDCGSDFYATLPIPSRSHDFVPIPISKKLHFVRLFPLPSHSPMSVPILFHSHSERQGISVQIKVNFSRTRTITKTLLA